MDDERWEEGMPVLDRQGIGHDRPPDRIPETAPTPLQKHYINLSAIALVAGALAITALETGSPLSSPIVKFCLLIAVPIFVITTADAALKFYRSAWAWMPVDVGRGLFRLTWVAAALLGIGIAVGAASIVLTA
ncbi:MAG TPA: hypothetical protein VHR16_11750 [Candidatus Limnocylindrales bacterium]|nr:hypothetical protein [Candidatus Limnocylindrales bacterium]